MYLLGLFVAILIQIIGTILLIWPVIITLPITAEKIVKLGAKIAKIEERKKIHKKMRIMYIIGLSLISIGLFFQIYFTWLPITDC